MELIIKISDKMFDAFKKHGIMTFDNLDEYDRDMVADAIATGTPYSPKGDCISREALKEHKVYSEERHEYVVPVYNVDNAQAVETFTLEDMQNNFDLGAMAENGKHDRPKGEWINHRNDYGHNIADCSLCGKTMQWHDEDGDGIPRYCWYCGADMQKGDAE